MYRSIFSECGSRVLDAVCPRFCIGCNVRMASEERGYICKNCLSDIQLHDGACCSLCGRLMDRIFVGEKRVCQACAELNPNFDAGVSIFSFDGIGRSIIHAIKYKRGTFLRSNILSLISEVASVPFLDNAIFVPVPLHFYRHFRRGFNQSEWISKLLAKEKNGRVENLLIRKRHTRTQTSLTKDERLRNVKNAFKLKKSSSVSKECRYVLVDDVYTTGSTLNSCAKVLKSAGADFVGIFTLGHG